MTEKTAPPCKICAQKTVFLESCDFHNNGKLHRGYFDAHLPETGIILDYYLCPACGFMFTPFMDHWGPAEFGTYVYNKDYPRIDGSYNGYRAGAAANIFYLAFFENLSSLSFLDYGGGLGIQSVLLKAFGAKEAVTYDPFAVSGKRPTGSFNMVTCLEVLEHSVDPRKTVADLVRFADPASSLIFISTETTPADIAAQKTKWWYVAPRVGHVSFQSTVSLEKLFAEQGWRMVHIESHTHIAYKTWPSWAMDFLPQKYIPQM